MLRFIHRHYRSCVVLVSLVWFGCYFLFDLGLAALALLDCGCLALLFVLASLYLRRVTRTYSEACDPEPYLELGTVREAYRQSTENLKSYMQCQPPFNPFQRIPIPAMHRGRYLHLP